MTNDKFNFTTSTRLNSKEFKEYLGDFHFDIHSYVYELSEIDYTGVAFATADNLHSNISNNLPFRLWLLDNKTLGDTDSR